MSCLLQETATLTLRWIVYARASLSIDFEHMSNQWAPDIENSGKRFSSLVVSSLLFDRGAAESCSALRLRNFSRWSLGCSSPCTTVILRYEIWRPVRKIVNAREVSACTLYEEVWAIEHGHRIRYVDYLLIVRNFVNKVTSVQRLSSMGILSRNCKTLSYCWINSSTIAFVFE